jgi:hypothetical protein
VINILASKALKLFPSICSTICTAGFILKQFPHCSHIVLICRWEKRKLVPQHSLELKSPFQSNWENRGNISYLTYPILNQNIHQDSDTNWLRQIIPLWWNDLRRFNQIVFWFRNGYQWSLQKDQHILSPNNLVIMISSNILWITISLGLPLILVSYNLLNLFKLTFLKGKILLGNICTYLNFSNKAQLTWQFRRENMMKEKEDISHWPFFHCLKKISWPMIYPCLCTWWKKK